MSSTGSETGDPVSFRNSSGFRFLVQEKEDRNGMIQFLPALGNGLLASMEDREAAPL